MNALYITISTLCNKRGISGNKLCTDLGLSRSLLTDLKMGRKKTVTAETAYKLSKYFGVSVGYLLGLEKE